MLERQFPTDSDLTFLWNKSEIEILMRKYKNKMDQLSNN